MALVSAPNIQAQNQFQKAVKIISGLPDNGSFKPSNDLKLKFYSYFKQATFGACREAKPPFWDPVKRAKWEAWNSLGDMPKEEAMLHYVDTLRQVIDAAASNNHDSDSDVKQKLLNELDVTEPSSDFPSRHAVECVNLKTTRENGILHDENLNFIQRDSPVIENATGNVAVPDGAGGRKYIDKMNGCNDIVNNTFAFGNDTTKSLTKLPSLPSDEENFADASDVEILRTSNGILTTDEVPGDVFSHNSILETSTPTRSPDVNAHKISGAPSRNTSSLLDSKGARPEKKLNRNEKCSKNQHVVVNDKRAENLDMLTTILSEISCTFGNAGKDGDHLLDTWQAAIGARPNQFSLTHAELRLLKRLSSNSKSCSIRRHRGQSSNKPGPSGDGPHQQHSQRNHTESDAHSSGTEGGDSANRNGRQGRSSSRTGSESSSVDSNWDPNVGTILLKMHRELQQISRKLELMESVLIVQQQMIRSSFSNQNRNDAFLLNLPWRTVIFILAWPVLVNFMSRFCWRRFFRRRIM